MRDASTLHIAQFNLARLRRGRDDPRLVSFDAGANMIRRAASTAPGHIWNTQDIIDDSIFATRSTWESLEALRSFVYSGIHSRYLNRHAEWFVEDDRINMALWCIKQGEVPTLSEAQSRLEILREQGPSNRAFDFSSASAFVRQRG